jgi:hypothetical protein
MTRDWSHEAFDQCPLKKGPRPASDLTDAVRKGLRGSSEPLPEPVVEELFNEYRLNIGSTHGDACAAIERAEAILARSIRTLAQNSGLIPRD